MAEGWRVPRFGDLERTALPAGAPVGPGAVRLRMRAWSLNYRDLLLLRGAYDPRLPLPYVPLSDGVGEVIEAGAASGFRPGERAVATFAPGWIDGAPDADVVRTARGARTPGLAAAEVVLDARELVRVPDGLSDAEAATLPCAGVTAWTALFRHGGVRPGSGVVVMGTGGVSLFALQLARAAGARVLATTTSPGKAELLRELGAAEVLDAAPGWGKAARAFGVDLVVDVGGAGTIRESVEACRVGGTIALVGNLAAGPGLDPVPAFMKQLRLQGVFTGARRDLEDLIRGLGAIRPVIGATVPFDALPEAFAALEARAHGGRPLVGKVAVAA
jgi:2-desacetyl-2-hydroxyethyl bacteriochlorophyllide A dehydrogenase